MGLIFTKGDLKEVKEEVAKYKVLCLDFILSHFHFLLCAVISMPAFDHTLPNARFVVSLKVMWPIPSYYCSHRELST